MNWRCTPDSPKIMALLLRNRLFQPVLVSLADNGGFFDRVFFFKNNNLLTKSYGLRLLS